jgi:SAM-dependent methyltransferase
MGIGMASIEYLVAKGLLRQDSRLLDIGSQNLYNATPENIRKFVTGIAEVRDEAAFQAEASRISYFSTPRPGERTAYLSELFDLAGVSYDSYDVCPALKSEIFDLNVERLPNRFRGAFDVVINFGTTEHLINQLNAFEVMHDALKVGGVAYHQMPSIGWIDHGYFNYNALFFDDLVKANRYEVVDRFYTNAGKSQFRSLPGADIRNQITPQIPNSAPSAPDEVLNFNLNYVFRKTVDAPLYVGLEIATTHSPLSDKIAAAYGLEKRLAAGDVIRRMASGGESLSRPDLRQAKGADLLSELMFRIRRRAGLV